MTVNILTIVQARTTSTRLPGKVLKKILGKPMLELQLERMRRAKCSDELIVATSDQASDNEIAHLCARLNIGCFRGSLEDVLDRYHRAAAHYNARHIVRMTADCPLAEPQVMDATITLHLDEKNDYTCADAGSGWPKGLDVEVVRRETLETAWREAGTPQEREHVTPFVICHPDRFRLGRLTAPTDYSNQRWTVDTPEDFSLAVEIYEALYPGNPQFGIEDILQLFRQRPNLAEINQ